MVKSKGFTLIEIMIVVAIVGILASMFIGPRGSSSSPSTPNVSTHDNSGDDFIINGIVHTCNAAGDCSPK